MAVAASIKFVQGALTPPAGEALIGVLAVLVVATNGDNTNVDKWEWEWFATPTGSGIVPGVIASGSIPSVSFTPDVRGTYVLALRTYDRIGNVSQDLRCFSVLEANGRLIPNFGAAANALNFGGQKLGWHPYVEAYLKRIDGLSVAVAAYEIDWSLGSVFYKTLAAGAQVFTFANAADGQVIVIEVVGSVSTLTWPVGIRWPGGAPPTQSASGTTIYTLVKSALGISGSAVDVS